jgi:hypothetical protein
MDRRIPYALAVAACLGVGLVIGLIDTSEGWDSPGLSGLLIAAVAFIVAWAMPALGSVPGWAVAVPVIVLGYLRCEDSPWVFLALVVGVVASLLGAVLGRRREQAVRRGPR